MRMTDDNDATLSWLEVNLAQAVEPYLLWRSNMKCVAIAKRTAAAWASLGMPERQGELLIEANEEAARRSGLAYGGEIVAARERAELACEAHGVSEHQVSMARVRAERLRWLEADVLREVLP